MSLEVQVPEGWTVGDPETRKAELPSSWLCRPITGIYACLSKQYFKLEQDKTRYLQLITLLCL